MQAFGTLSSSYLSHHRKQNFSISLSISSVITVAFDRLLTTDASLLVDSWSCKHRADRTTFLTPIATSYKWTLPSLVTPVLFLQQDNQWDQMGPVGPAVLCQHRSTVDGLAGPVYFRANLGGKETNKKRLSRAEY